MMEVTKTRALINKIEIEEQQRKLMKPIVDLSKDQQN